MVLHETGTLGPSGRLGSIPSVGVRKSLIFAVFGIWGVGCFAGRDLMSLGMFIYVDLFFVL